MGNCCIIGIVSCIGIGAATAQLHHGSAVPQQVIGRCWYWNRMPQTKRACLQVSPRVEGGSPLLMSGFFFDTALSSGCPELSSTYSEVSSSPGG